MMKTTTLIAVSVAVLATTARQEVALKDLMPKGW